MHSMQISKQACRCTTAATSRVTANREAFLVTCAGHQHQQPTALTPAGTAALSLAAVATAAQLILPAAAPAVVVPAIGSQPAEISRLQPIVSELSVAAAPAIEVEAEDVLDNLTEDVALPPELMRFMELITNGPVKSADQLQEARRSVGFERSPDGRVLLLTEDGEPFQVKADMGVPGMLLLRDAGGYCYYLPREDDSVLQQIDLSDDAVVAQLFANHAWEELVEPLEVVADDVDLQKNLQDSSSGGAEGPVGRLEQLRLSERQFRTVVSLIAGGQELPEEPLEQLDNQEQQQQ